MGKVIPQWSRRCAALADLLAPIITPAERSCFADLPIAEQTRVRRKLARKRYRDRNLRGPR
jgi:hypothetical protein